MNKFKDFITRNNKMIIPMIVVALSLFLFPLLLRVDVFYQSIKWWLTPVKNYLDVYAVFIGALFGTSLTALCFVYQEGYKAKKEESKAIYHQLIELSKIGEKNLKFIREIIHFLSNGKTLSATDGMDFTKIILISRKIDTFIFIKLCYKSNLIDELKNIVENFELIFYMCYEHIDYTTEFNYEKTYEIGELMHKTYGELQIFINTHTEQSKLVK